MSSSVRVKTRTSAPDRCTWIRMPSIFHSTAAGEIRSSAAASVGAVAASIGLERPSDLQGDGLQRPLGGRGVVRRARPARRTAAWASEPPTWWARRTSRPGTPAAAAMASVMTPPSAPWPQVAGQQPDQELPLVLGGLGQQLAQQLAPVGLRAGPGERADGAEGRVGLGQRQRGDRGGRRIGGRAGARAGAAGAGPAPPAGRGRRRPEQVHDGGVADADLALGQLAGQERDRDRDLPGGDLAEQRGDLGHLGQAAGRPAHRG